MGDRIRQARLDAELTQADVATRMGLKQQSVQAWESGRSRPGAANLSLLAQVLGTTVDSLLGHEVRSVSPASGADLEWVRENDPATWKFIVDTAKAARRRQQ
jgi:transcriptional regulator with XRE-family HTH domain